MVARRVARLASVERCTCGRNSLFRSRKDTITTIVLHGLCYLAEEVEYTRYLSDDGVPTVRILWVQLVSQMAKP